MTLPRPLQAGRKNDPLPDGTTVIRLLKKTTNDGKVPPDAFELSSQDKEAIPPSISVWATYFTTPEQAREFMGDNKEAYSLFCSLGVDQVRAIRPLPDSPEVGSLDVVWDPLTRIQDDMEVPDTRLGAEGHAGITGLLRPPGLPKSLYFSLRSQLADIANTTLKRIVEG